MTASTIYTLMSEIEPEPITWLWKWRIPSGELTTLDGDPATNKSCLTLDLGARVSTGSPMPDGTAGVEGGVLLLVGEDSIRKTLPHRLAAAGARMDRIVVMEKGSIIEEGNHDGLLKQNGHYATLYNTYFRHQSLAYIEQMKELVGDD